MSTLSNQVTEYNTGGFDVEKIREDFPVLKQKIHGKPLVYLDNAATAEQVDYVLELRPDAADRTFVLGEFGRLLRSVSRASLPAAGRDADAVYERGVALVAAVAAVRGGKPAEPDDDLDDPWGRGDPFFGRVADEVEATVRPLAELLLRS